MIIIHEFWKCIHCGETTEISDDMRKEEEITCDFCGYSLEFKDYRFETWEEGY